MITKAEINRRSCARPNLPLHKLLNQALAVESIPNDQKETILKEYREVFTAYYNNTREEIIYVPAWDAAELVQKVLKHWRQKAFDKKQASKSTLRQFEKISALRESFNTANQEVAKLTQSLADKESHLGELDPKISQALEAKEAAVAEAVALLEELKKPKDLKLTLEGAKGQVRDGELEISWLTAALKDVQHSRGKEHNKRKISYDKVFDSDSRSSSSSSFSNDGKSHRRQKKKSTKKDKRDRYVRYQKANK